MRNLQLLDMFVVDVARSNLSVITGDVTIDKKEKVITDDKLLREHSLILIANEVFKPLLSTFKWALEWLENFVPLLSTFKWALEWLEHFVRDQKVME